LNIVTTTYVNNDIKCTFTDGLHLQDIGAISIHAKYIVGVHSGTMAACYNSLTKRNVKKWFIFAEGKIHSEINVDNDSSIGKVYDFFNHLEIA
jgi:hypothetical protein